MTVGELVAELQKLDQDAIAIVYDPTSDAYVEETSGPFQTDVYYNTEVGFVCYDEHHQNERIQKQVGVYLDGKCACWLLSREVNNDDT